MCFFLGGVGGRGWWFRGHIKNFEVALVILEFNGVFVIVDDSRISRSCYRFLRDIFIILKGVVVILNVLIAFWRF